MWNASGFMERIQDLELENLDLISGIATCELHNFEMEKKCYGPSDSYVEALTPVWWYLEMGLMLEGV